MGDTQFGAHARNLHSLASAFRAQAVIDRRRLYMVGPECMGQEKQGQAIGTTRYRDPEAQGQFRPGLPDPAKIGGEPL